MNKVLLSMTFPYSPGSACGQRDSVQGGKGAVFDRASPRTRRSGNSVCPDVNPLATSYGGYLIRRTLPLRPIARRLNRAVHAALGGRLRAKQSASILTDQRRSILQNTSTATPVTCYWTRDINP